MAPHSHTAVGIRRLRDNLSRYVGLVQNGGQIVVTDRGRPVARLVAHDPDDPLERLIEQGLARRAVSSKRKAPQKRAPASGDVSPLVGEQRR